MTMPWHRPALPLRDGVAAPQLGQKTLHFTYRLISTHLEHHTASTSHAAVLSNRAMLTAPFEVSQRFFALIQF